MISSKPMCLLALLIACICIGCGDSNRARIIGNWGIEQPESVMNRLPDSSESEIGNDERVEPEPPRMLLKFYRSGVLETSTRMGSVNQEKSGRWTFDSYDEASQTMRVTCEIQGQKAEQGITFIDPDTIELVPPNMAGLTMKLRFKRQ